MKVVAVLGSPRVNGVSASVMNRVLEGARDAGHEVVVYEIDKMKVNGCRGCGYCKIHHADCCIRDDLSAYWNDLHEAGALIVSAPNYYSQVCGPMITFMNRHYCLMGKDRKPRLEAGKKLIGILSEGMPQPYEEAEKNFRWYLQCLSVSSMEVKEPLICSAAAMAQDGGEMLQKAYETGRNL